MLLAHLEHGLRHRLQDSGIALHRGATWTTDALYRESEAAASYASATARGVLVARLAHVTNSMGQQPGADFEKGGAEGIVTALRIVEVAAMALRSA